MIKVSLPRFVEIPRKTKKNKKFWIDLNTYINSHYRVRHEAKQIYIGLIEEELKKLPKITGFPLRIKYVICKKPTKEAEKASKKLTNEDFKKSEGFAPFKGELEGKNNWDIGNMAVQGKFFEDALVKLGIIPDDSIPYIHAVGYFYGGSASDEIWAEIIES